MTEKPVRSLMRIIYEERPASEGGPYKSRTRAKRISEAHLAVVLLCCVVSVLGGCSVRKRPSIPWATEVQVRPVALPPTAASSVADDSIPELRFELPPFPSRLIPVRTGPARPRAGAGPGATTGNDAEKQEAPTIAPQLTPQESAVARQQTMQSLSIAEKNLEAARGKNLNAAQSDLISKIRNFIKDAGEAAQITDWSRARSLAKKAQVLSEELAGSL
jgi:hypothetical protein